MNNTQPLYVFTCPRGCSYAPGFFAKRPIGDQYCHGCRSQLRPHIFHVPGPSEPPKWEGSD